MNDYAGERQGGLHRAVDRLEQFLEQEQFWVALAAATLLFLLQMPGINDLAAEIGVDDNVQLLTAGAVVILTSILIELRQLDRRVSPAITGLQHYSDPQAMYHALIGTAAGITEVEKRRIDVLGLTLYSAWPEIQFFLERPDVSRWQLRLAAVSPEANAEDLWVPSGWPREAETTIAQVDEFRERRGVDHHHTIETFEYRFPPVVHGFRLGNGDIFVSTLRWRPEGFLGKHRFPYDYVPAHDVSPEADAARALFTSWFDRALASHAEAGGRPAPNHDHEAGGSASG